MLALASANVAFSPVAMRAPAPRMAAEGMAPDFSDKYAPCLSNARVHPAQRGARTHRAALRRAYCVLMASRRV